MHLCPFLLEPVYKEKPWGGDMLARVFGRRLPSSSIGESWELSCHPHGVSAAAGGPYAGLSLPEIISMDRVAVLGERDAREDRFPLLIKFLDIEDLISVQVHPSDAYAAAHEKGDPGKTEAWYVLHTGPDACVYMGLNPCVDKRTLEEGIREGTLKDMLRRIPVKKGDVVHIPAGTVHTANGILLCEVQQNSDATYRVYDWRRVGPDGKGRPLHIEQALDVIDFSGRQTGTVRGISHAGEGYTRTLYVSCPHFAMEEIRCAGAYQDDTGGLCFHVLSCIEGQGRLIWQDAQIPFAAGQTVFIPAAAGGYAVEGHCAWIKAYRPVPEDMCSLLCAWGKNDEAGQAAGLIDYLEGL